MGEVNRSDRAEVLFRRPELMSPVELKVNNLTEYKFLNYF